jgi:hypothetical protein
MNTITVKGQTINEEILSGATLVGLAEMYNKAALELDPEARTISKFSSKEVAIKRTYGVLLQLAALEKQSKESRPTKKEKVVKEKTEHKGRSSNFSGKKLRPLVDENPRREGTWGFKSMAIILSNPGITYEDFVAAGGRNNDLVWDIKHGHVVAE